MREEESLGTRLALKAFAAGMMLFLALAILFGCVNWAVLPWKMKEERRAQCLHNCRELGLALKQYAQDFEQIYPWHAGASEPENAWLDLGLLYPCYLTGFEAFLCPSSQERGLKAPAFPDEKEAFDTLKPANSKEAISYAYGVDASLDTALSWSESASATLRLLADKKAGIEIKGSFVELAAHKDEGRNVLYQDGHAQWEPGGAALDPDVENNEVGRPDADDYSKWWSDPPWYGEGMGNDEAAEESEN